MLGHRERVRTDTHLFEPIGDARSLELHVHKLRDDLAQLRRRHEHPPIMRADRQPYEEIANTLGLSPTAVRVKVHRARIKLLEMCEKKGELA